MSERITACLCCLNDSSLKWQSQWESFDDNKENKHAVEKMEVLDTFFFPFNAMLVLMWFLTSYGT